MNVPYGQQLARKQSQVEQTLSGVLTQAGVDDVAGFFQPPAASPESGFRNKAKMVVTGTSAAPRLGILDPHQHPKHHDGSGVDLRHCGLYEPGLRVVFPIVGEFISTVQLTPYNVGSRTGELKHVIFTLSPQQELMVRFVLRSTRQLDQIRQHLPALLKALAAAHVPARVVTANILPEHQALLEGEKEIHLAGDASLIMLLNGVPLNLRPQGFFQTNTVIAASLYWQAADWVDGLAEPIESVWDLYAGVGGFGFSLAQARSGPHAGTRRKVLGVETSDEAVAAAQHTIEALGLTDSVRYTATDATKTTAYAENDLPDLVVVNPPRRGIGAELASWINARAHTRHTRHDINDDDSTAQKARQHGTTGKDRGMRDPGIKYVLYSSCNAKTLAKDLTVLDNFQPVTARMLDMFPQTDHCEVLVLLRSRASATS